MPKNGSLTKPLSRRTALSVLAGGIAGVGLAGLSSSPAEAKVSKASVGYRGSPNGGRACRNCANFRPANSTCRVVSGSVSANGWCTQHRAARRGSY